MIDRFRFKNLDSALHHFTQINPASHGPEKRLSILFRFASVQLGFPGWDRVRALRVQWWRSLRNRKGGKFPCWVCKGPSQVDHHVIQLQYGGTNRKDNRVPLCNRCHEEVHPWLKKEAKPRDMTPRLVKAKSEPPRPIDLAAIDKTLEKQARKSMASKQLARRQGQGAVI